MTRLKYPFGLLIFFLILIFSSSSLSAQSSQSANQGEIERDKALNEALRCIKMTKDDLRLRSDYVEKDSFRLKVIDYLMASPLTTLSFSERMGEKLAENKNSPEKLIWEPLILWDPEIFFKLGKEKDSAGNFAFGLSRFQGPKAFERYNSC